MATLEELIAQREALDAQIHQAREGARKEAIEKVRTLVDQYGLSPEDIFGRTPRAARGTRTAGPRAAAKYRDPQTGATWSGRGKPPGWIKGKDRGPFLIG